VPANHFPTPSAADGLLLAPSSDNVVAFAASAATSGSASASTSAAPTSAATQPSGGGGLPARAIVGIVIAGLAVIGWTAWLLWRRRTNGSG
jgi:hypothetical protein